MAAAEGSEIAAARERVEAFTGRVQVDPRVSSPGDRRPERHHRLAPDLRAHRRARASGRRSRASPRP